MVFRVMDPLQAVEDILGDIDTWPSYTIYFIFIEKPCSHSIRLVAAFMYGNGVPLDVAVDCFNACCGISCSWVLSKWYSTWDTHSRLKVAEYYSIFFKQWLRLNGEPFKPNVTVTQFGIDGIDETGSPQFLRTKFDHVRGKM